MGGTNGGERLRLDLKLDNKKIDTDDIFLGGEGAHPESNPFTLHR